MRLRINLQWKILLLVAGTMSLILLASSYLHRIRTRTVIEQDHYESAVSQTLTIVGRISEYDYFSNLEDLQQEIQLVAGSRPDFKQIEVYQNATDGPHLIATTSPGAQNLLSSDYIVQSMNDPQHSGVSSAEIQRKNGEYWLLTVDIANPKHSGFLKALVLKSYHNVLVSSLHRQYNLVLVGAEATSVVLLYLLFVYFFRHPVRDIVQAMAEARGGHLSARALVRRDDELGEIARGFNQLMDEINERSLERDALLRQISGFNDQLLKKVKSATADLREANANLIRIQQRLACAERMAAMGQVAASLAHEIGTPLNAMAGHLQLLARNHPHSVDTQRRLKIINSQLASIVETVKSLIERTHRRPIAPQLTDINSIVQELLLLVEPIFESRNIQVCTRLDQELPRVPADPETLHQVFLNLVNNSIEAMPQGGRLEIVTDYLPNLGMIEVRFIDSGVGIAAEVKEHLFEPMWTTKQSGSGLGLAIAREIILEHRGEIECVTGLPQGAQFRLTLPVVESTVALRNHEVRIDAA